MMIRAAMRETQAMPRRQPRAMPAIAPPETPFFLDLLEVLEFVGEESDVGVGRSGGSARTWGLAFSSNTH